MWVRSHVVRDYAWVWVPWTAAPADGQRRWMKVDADSGGGQLEIDISPRAWTFSEREALRQRNELAGAAVYHRTFGDVPRAYARSIPPTAWNAVGFKWYRGPTHVGVCIPYWSIALPVALVPAAWVAGWSRRRRRARTGLCAVCGYDLRASPDRCPECGTPAKVEATPPSAGTATSVTVCPPARG